MRNLIPTLSIVACFFVVDIQAQSDRYLHFDGVNDFAEVPNASQYFVGATAISMTGWFCSQGLGYGHGYFGFRGPGNGDGQMYVIELGTGNLECRYISTTGFNEYVSPAGTVQPGVWQHVTWTYNGATTSLYINGQFVGSTPSGGTFAATTRSFGIGKSIENGFNFVFGGRIDEVTVWSKGLTQAEILDIMANEPTGSEPDLQLYYKMNQGIPAGNNTGITQLISEVDPGPRNADLINFGLNGPTSNFNASNEDPSFTASDHCQGAINQATVTGTPGGTFSFANTVNDGATIDAVTGTITGGIAGTTYSIQYITNGTCPISSTQDVTILTEDDASFVFPDFCSTSANGPNTIATPGGTFAFDPDPMDGASIDPLTGQISNSIAGNAYNVAYTTNGACPNSQTVTTNALTTDDPGFNLDDFCLGLPNQATAIQTPGGTFTFDPDPMDGAIIDPSTAEISNEVAGTDYSIQYTTNGVCGASLTQVISVLSYEDPSFELSDFCEGSMNSASDVITPGGTFSFNPDPGDGTSINALTAEITGGLPGNIYSIQYTTNGPCPSSETNTVTVLIQDDPGFTLDDSCPGVTILPSDIASPGGMFSLMPDPMDGSNVDPLTGALNDVIPGSSYTLEYTTAGQCPDISSASISIFTSPIISNLTEECAMDETSYTVSFDISEGDLSSYQVNGAGTLSGNTFTSDPIPSGDAYDFSVSDMNACGSDQVTGEVMCMCLATATFSDDITICEGEIGTISINLSGEGPWTLAYELDGIAQVPILSAVDLIEIDVTDQGLFEFLSISDANCTNSLAGTSIEVTVIPAPSAVLQAGGAICDGETLELEVDFTGTGPWTFAYSIEGLDQMPVTTMMSSYSFNTAVPGTYLIESINDANCPGSAEGIAEVMVNPLPTASILGDLTLCVGSEATIPITLIGTPDYTLTYSIDGQIQPSLNIGEPSSFDLVTAETGNYELISISDFNCSGSVEGSVLISEQALPTASIDNASYTICSGSSQVVDIELTGSPNWSVTYAIDGVEQAVISSSASPFELLAADPGVYELISVEDAFCENNTGIEQVIIAYHPPIGITYSEDVEVCLGEQAQVWAEPFGGLGDQYTFDWQDLGLVNSDEVTATYELDVSTAVSVTINEECNYDQTFEIPITVHQLPPISITGESEVCGADTLTLVNGTPANYVGNLCQWVLDGDTIEDCGSIAYFFEEGEYDVGLEITSPEGCFASLFLEDYIQVNPPTTAQFQMLPQEVTTVEPDVSFVNLSSNALDFMWSFGTEEVSYDFEPDFDFGASAGLWQVCLTTNNEFGCIDSVCDVLRVKNELLVSIPNAFTPNNDGVNDLFYPIIYGADAEDYEFTIYDRNGSIIFNTIDINAKWNGNYESEMNYYTTESVFQWKLLTKSLGSAERRVFTGSVLLLR